MALDGVSPNRVYSALSFKTGAYSVVAADKGKTFVATGSASWTLGLLAAASATDFQFKFKNGGTGVITLDPNSTELVNGVTTLAIYPGETCDLFCDGTAWYALGLSAGWVPIATLDVTGQSSIDILNLGGFKTLKCHVNIGPVTNIQQIGLRLSDDNGATFKSAGTDYSIWGQYMPAATINGVNNTQQGTFWVSQASTLANIGGAYNVTADITLDNFNVAGLNCGYRQDDHYLNSSSVSYKEEWRGYTGFAANARSALRFYAASGNISGRVILEGIRG